MAREGGARLEGGAYRRRLGAARRAHELAALARACPVASKSWAGPILTALFAWLGVFILLSNPPFSDIAPPRVGGLDFYIEDDDGWNTTVAPDADATLLFVVDLRDNREVTEARLALQKDGAGLVLDGAAYGRLQLLPAGNAWGVEASYGWYFLLDEGLDTGSYTVRITAFDVAGNEKQRSFLLDIAA